MIDWVHDLVSVHGVEHIAGLTRSKMREEFGLSEGKAKRLRAWVDGATSRIAAGAGFPENFSPTPIPRVSDLLLADELPEAVPVAGLIQRRCDSFRALSKRRKAERVRAVKVPDGLPLGVLHFGDPHVDDGGCNWPLLRSHVELVQKTDGLVAGNVGDVTNNWVGRLEKLYSKQETTFSDGVRLAKWLLTSCEHLYFVTGNHDKWNHGDALMREITEGASISVMASTEARITLEWPGAPEPIRIMVRHNFKGSSIWNPAHGAMRAAKLEPWADLLVNGHTHEWVGHSEEGTNGRPWHCLTVRGYKHFDGYASEHQFHDHIHGAACLTILDPWAPPAARVRVMWDVEEGAKYLEHLRELRRAA